MGDVLLQKSYTVDFLTKKKKKNNGELTQYYITDNHPAIIPREDFLNVQLELTRRNSKKKVSQKKTKRKYFSKYALLRKAGLRRMRFHVSPHHLGEKRQEEK